MSDRDTDDTDVLLNADPMGGLFLDLSLKDLTQKHKNLLPSEEEEPPASKSSDNNLANGDASQNQNNLELSDYFNSQGEIVLSGLSEWSESDTDVDSDAGFTFKPASSKGVHDERGGGDADSGAVEAVKTKNCDKSNAGDVNKIQDSSSTTKEPPSTVTRSLPLSSQCYHPQFLNRGQVVDINLENSATGWNIPLPSFLQGASGDTSGVIMTENGEQIFTRAPNFRSSGGYKPSNNSQPSSRHLTEQQVREEVRKMYESQEQKVEEKDENSNPASEITPKVLRFADEIAAEAELASIRQAHASSSQGFDFLNGEDPVNFESQHTSKDEKSAVRKKHVASKGKRKSKKSQSTTSGGGGAGDCGISADSSPSPSVRFADKDQTSSYTDSPLVIPTPPTSTKSSSIPYCTKVVRGMKRANAKPHSMRPGFSFGYGDSENDLSPIRHNRNINVFNTPKEIPQPKSGAAALEELKAIWREIQMNRTQLRHHREDDDDEEEESYIEELGHVSPTPNSKSQDDTESSTSSKQSPTKNYQQNPKNKQFAAPNFENFDSDLEALLNEVEINPADFEDIVDDLNIAECDVGAGIDDLLSEIIDPTTSADDKEQAQISHWAQSGAVEYVEKYHEENFRRRECEDEIARLQKEILEIKQTNAVLQGTMKRKDATIFKITKAWKDLSQEWKSFESKAKNELERLKTENHEVTTACAQGKERIDQYEKELIKSVEMADTFKIKLTELQTSKDFIVTKLETDVKNLNCTVDKLTQGIDEITEEKKAAFCALKQAQQQLDKQQEAFKKVKAELLSLENQNLNAHNRLEDALNEKSKLAFVLEEKTVQNEELRNKVKELTIALELASAEKEMLNREYENSTVQKLKNEGERLHEYYNKKLQDALRSAAEKAAKAQGTLVESMKKSSLDSERKLSECKERFHSDLMRMKTIYEVEIQDLKKDNLQKQLLISTTAQQLQAGGIVRHDAVDKLQTIVSNFSKSSRNSLSQLSSLAHGDGADNILALSSNRLSENTTTGGGVESTNSQYAKFVQNLAKSNATIHHSVNSKPNNFQNPAANIRPDKEFPIKYSSSQQTK